MLVDRFSPQAEQDLRAAGWRPGRAVDVAGWRQRLEASGEVRMHPAAAEFLAEFGGLNVEMDGQDISVAVGLEKSSLQLRRRIGTR
ncbi:hypothetical protein DL990_32970 [Amycolatopsis sp. WAC 01416]|uniref:SUKH-3 domain-containing protein n=1 Tax=Amycolatopsis sp. WAC 01416 TaxID=2203196 RepID=UPI000F7A4487|nr:hypothetical protein DL990_32970 [Amycolatopsis sp. WAC 01416]